MRSRHVLFALVVGAVAACQHVSAAEARPVLPGDQAGEPLTTRQAILKILRSGGTLRDDGGRSLPVFCHEGKTPKGFEPTYVLPAKLPSVASVDLSASSLSPEELSVLRAFPHLSELSLAPRMPTATGMRHLAELESLETLRLRQAVIPEASAEGLRTLTQLKELRLPRARPAAFSFLASLTNLEKLDLSNTPFADKDVAHLLALTKLSMLNLEATHLTDDGILRLRGMTHLRELAISGWRFSEPIALLLRSLPDLKSLRISFSRVDLPAMRHLRNIPGITSLCFGGSELDDQMLAHVAGLPELKVIWIPSTRVTDKGLVHLAGLPKLDELGLENNPTLTDSGLEHIAKITSLRTLVVRNTGVSPRGVDALKRLRPNLRVLR